MTALEMAKKYYPILWPVARIEALVAAGKLTADEYKEITGEAYESGATT